MVETKLVRNFHTYSARLWVATTVFNVTLFPHSSLNCSNFEVNIMLQGEEKYKWNAQVGQEDVALIYCQYGARVR